MIQTRGSGVPLDSWTVCAGPSGCTKRREFIGIQEVTEKENAMEKLTRRGLIAKGSLGAAAIGALVAVPGMGTAHAAPQAPQGDGEKAMVEGPLMAHVRDLTTGEIALYVGTREIIVHDRALVGRLVRAAR
jgi:hypothetical protein